MKALYFLLLIVAVSCFISCNDKCRKTKITEELQPLMQQYFSNYIPGNYFIYYNQDSTKRDSIYITDYTQTSQPANLNECTFYPGVTFTINSNYLGYNFKDSLVNIQVFYGCNCCYTGLETTFQGYSPNIYLQAVPGVDSLQVLTGVIGPVVTQITNFVLWKNSANKLPVVTKYGGLENSPIYFAPTVGIAEYVTYNKKDTFRIVRYKIQ